jgi:AcrR family transcriptional regulator
MIDASSLLSRSKFRLTAYQYFPGKEALVAAVIERHNQELMQVARDALLKVAGLPMEQAVRKFVAIGIEDA